MRTMWTGSVPGMCQRGRDKMSSCKRRVLATEVSRNCKRWHLFHPQATVCYWHGSQNVGQSGICDFANSRLLMTSKNLKYGLSSDGEQHSWCNTLGVLNETLKRIRASCEPVELSLSTLLWSNRHISGSTTDQELCQETVGHREVLRSPSEDVERTAVILTHGPTVRRLGVVWFQRISSSIEMKSKNHGNIGVSFYSKCLGWVATTSG